MTNAKLGGNIPARKFKFTATSVANAVSLFSDMKGITLRDTDEVGFILRKQRKDWVFAVEKWSRGRTVRFSLETWTPETSNIAAIRKQAASTIAQIDEGTFIPGAERRAVLRSSDSAMRQTVDEAIAVHQELNPRTRESTVKTYRAQLRAAFGLDTRFALISRGTIAAWYEEKLSAGRSAAGLNATLAAFKAVWSSWASQLKDQDSIGENPAVAFGGKRQKNLRPAKVRETSLKPEHVAPFIRATLAEMHERGNEGAPSAAIAFAALTGLRIGDVVNLTVDDVTDNAVRISADQTKGKVDIVRPITPLMREVLDHQREYAVDGRLFQVMDTRRAIQRACQIAGSPVVTNHDLRRSYITVAALARVPELAVKLLVGHKPSNITESYALSIRRELPRFAADIEDALMADRVVDDGQKEWWT